MFCFSKFKLLESCGQFRAITILSANNSRVVDFMRPTGLNSFSVQENYPPRKLNQHNSFSRNIYLKVLTRNEHFANGQIKRFLTTESTITTTTSSSVFIPNEDNLKKLRTSWYVDNMNLGDMIWNECYDVLACYGSIHGTCNVPLNSMVKLPNGKIFQLSFWLDKQRKLKMKNKLNRVRLNKLQSLVNSKLLRWEIEVAVTVSNTAQWNTMYNHLVEYGEQHNGDCNVPYNYIVTLPNSAQIKLGSWLSYQRQQYRLQKLAKERRIQLQLLASQNKFRWDVMTLKLNTLASPPPLISPLPSITKTKNSSLVLPDETAEERWNRMYNHLVEYGEKHDGNCNVPSTFTINQPDKSKLKLGQWLAYQHQKYKSGSLSQERLNQLQILIDQNKLLWNSTEMLKDSQQHAEVKWNSMYNLLLEYGENQEDKNCNVSSRFTLTLPDDTVVKLGLWLSTQRHKYKNGSLSQDRLQRLQELVNQNRLVWDTGIVHTDRWDAMFNHVVEYGEKHNGDCNVPEGYTIPFADNPQFRLGWWLIRNKINYHSGALQKDKKLKLEKLVTEGKLNWKSKK